MINLILIKIKNILFTRLGLFITHKDFCPFCECFHEGTQCQRGFE